MTTDRSAILSGIRTGASATSTVATAIQERFFNITGVNGQQEPFGLPWDAGNMSMRVIVTTPGGATTSNSYTIKKVGVAADVMKISAIGSAAGSFSSFTTTSASLIALPNGPVTTGSVDPVLMKVSAISTDVNTRGVVIVTYGRNNGSADGYSM